MHHRIHGWSAEVVYSCAAFNANNIVTYFSICTFWQAKPESAYFKYNCRVFYVFYSTVYTKLQRRGTIKTLALLTEL